MDTFLLEIGRQLQEESNALTSFVEPEHKQLAVRTYECMAACFRSPAAAIQNNFQSCMQTCALKVVQDDGDQLRTCVAACHQATVKSFAETRSVIKELIAKYQS